MSSAILTALAAFAIAAAACSAGAREDGGSSTPERVATAAVASVTDGGPVGTGPEAGSGSIGDAMANDQVTAKKIARALRLVSKARQLSVLRPVGSHVLARKDLIAYVKGRVTKEVPAEAIEREGRVLAMLGFLPTDYDYLAGTLGLLDAQLAGLYEPNDGAMYLASDLEDSVAESTLDHELTHALQDQHFDLRARTKYVPGKSDAQEALSALSEGDAMSAMVDVLLVRQKARGKTALDVPDSMFRAQAAGMNEGKAASAPEVMKAVLIAPYIDGTLFVQALRRAGGWAAVDEAWRHPPSSTEQLLHLEKFQLREEPLRVESPPPPPSPPPSPPDGATGASEASGATGGWTLADTDTYGELELRIFLSQWFGAELGAKMADGWGGDRGALYERGTESAFALHVRYDEGVKLSPRSFFDRLTRKLGKPRILRKDQACFERGDRGPLLVRIGERDLVLLVAGDRVVNHVMSSSATCADAVAWGKRILDGP